MRNIAKSSSGQNALFLLVSGIFDERNVISEIPDHLREKAAFLPKPLTAQHIKEAVAKFKLEESGLFSISESGVTDADWSESLSGRKLIHIILSRNQEKFSGALLLRGADSRSSSVSFRAGRVIDIQAKGFKSYFGELLVEHGFFLQKEVEEALHEQNEKLGRALIKKGLLSPHLVSFILKEQAKIRLSEWVSFPSFQMRAEEQKKEPEDLEMMELGRQDILDWAIDCVQNSYQPCLAQDFL